MMWIMRRMVRILLLDLRRSCVVGITIGRRVRGVVRMGMLRTGMWIGVCISMWWGMVRL